MSGRAALAFTVASAFGAALNYLFQVHAATVLDAAAFGLLSAWLARVTLLGMFATVAQFVSLDYRTDDGQFRRVLRIAGLVSVGAVGAHLAAGTQIPTLYIGASAVIGGIVLYTALGQLQARLQLGVVAIALVVTAALRFGLPFAWARDARAPAFYVAHAVAFFAGVVAAAIVVIVRPAAGGIADVEAKADAKANAGEGDLRLKRPLLLAFATVLFPLLDVLIISATRDAATTGAYSRVALASRVVLFAGVAALQILLPHQLHVAVSRGVLPPFALLLQRWLTPAMIGGAIALAALLDQRILPLQGEERVWLFTSCLTAALLVAILGQINRFAAHGRLGLAAWCVAGVVVTSAAAAGLSMLAQNEPVTRYALAVLAGNALVVLVASVAQMRRVAAAA